MRRFTQSQLDEFARRLSDAADDFPEGLVIHIAVASPYHDGTHVAVRSTLEGEELQQFTRTMADAHKREIGDVS